MNIRDGVLVVREGALAAAGKASWLPPLLIRLCLAAVFIPSGWGAGAVAADGLLARVLFHPNEQQQRQGDRS
jgi:uncharacterized membrane protein YphA (DoxX/SURF4 family)